MFDPYPCMEVVEEGFRITGIEEAAVVHADVLPVFRRGQGCGRAEVDVEEQKMKSIMLPSREELLEWS